MDKIKDYEIISKIGEGGMATVYKACQKSLDRPVAIKVLSKRLTENRALVERFNQEALIIARLTHPNVIHIIDRGITSGRHYFVMDFVEGTDFSRMIRDGKSDSKTRMDIIIQVCKALFYAHKNGVIHRDIKPANILLDGEGNAMVSDFGIAQLFDTEVRGEVDVKKGGVMGTPVYMSPEQRVGDPGITYLTDIYSLGVVIYEVFTGVRPVAPIKAPSALNSKFPKTLETIIMQCLETEPADRYQSANELKDALLGMLKGGHIGASKRKDVFQGIQRIQDRFILLDIIKENDYGAVYLFKKKDDNTLMVIKKIRNQRNNPDQLRVLSKISNNSIAKLYGISGDKNLFIIVMEYVEGGCLRDRMLTTYRWPEALKMVKEIARGLQFAHDRGVVHGNLRPSNVLITKNDEVKLSDFALEEHYADKHSVADWYRPTGEDASVTADIFALGVIFYELVVGNLPEWIGENLVSNDIFDTLPVKLRDLIEGMLILDPKGRYEDAELVLADIGIIEELLQKKKNEVKRSSRLFLLTILLILLALYYGLNHWKEILAYSTTTFRYWKGMIQRINLDMVIERALAVKDKAVSLVKGYINR